MDFDNFCSFFECHSILAEKQQTKQTNYSFLSLSPFLDTQDTFHSAQKCILSVSFPVDLLLPWY